MTKMMRMIFEGRKKSVDELLGLEPPLVKHRRIQKERSPEYLEGMKDGEAAFHSQIRALAQDRTGMQKWQHYGFNTEKGDAYAHGWSDGHTQGSAKAKW